MLDTLTRKGKLRCFSPLSSSPSLPSASPWSLPGGGGANRTMLRRIYASLARYANRNTMKIGPYDEVAEFQVLLRRRTSLQPQALPQAQCSFKGSGRLETTQGLHSTTALTTKSELHSTAPIAQIGAVAERRHPFYVASRRIVEARASGRCEHCGRRAVKLEWAHIFGRSGSGPTVVSEPWCSTPALTMLLCASNPSTGKQGCHTLLDEVRDKTVVSDLRRKALIRFLDQYCGDSKQQLTQEGVTMKAILRLAVEKATTLRDPETVVQAVIRDAS